MHAILLQPSANTSIWSMTGTLSGSAFVTVNARESSAWRSRGAGDLCPTTGTPKIHDSL